MMLERLPGDLRVRLPPEREQELWHEVEETGISRAAEETGYSRSLIYGWRSRDLFLPAGFVAGFLGDPEVEALKGSGSGTPTWHPSLDFPELPELRTRALLSSVVNRDGVPVYQTKEHSLMQRFVELLEKLGEVERSVYSRQLHEVRYPAHVYSMLQNLDLEHSFAAEVDEVGKVTDGELVAGGCEVSVEEFDAELHSRSRRLELALQRGDEEAIESILGEEASRVRSAFSR